MYNTTTRNVTKAQQEFPTNKGEIIKYILWGQLLTPLIGMRLLTFYSYFKGSRNALSRQC